MKYFHRTSVAPDDVVARAARYFGARMSPTEEGPRRRKFSSAVGQLSVSVQAEGGHYTLVTVETNQPGESELDKFAKRFLGTVHTMADETHALRGAY
ncbi:MAG: hypothetical protein SFV24_12820 [Gemmatimonadales bacterium]|nr:hypothetical protein [Gemmatimonadales bacterium]MDX2058679.1 hypothetical protein [Gemmatimonadales bacterium]